LTSLKIECLSSNFHSIPNLSNAELKDAQNRIVVHSLRHTFASLLVIAGTPIYNLMRLMNHASMDMSMCYAHLAPDFGKDAVNNLIKAS